MRTSRICKAAVLGLTALAFGCGTAGEAIAQSGLPMGSAPAPLTWPHFPSRQCAFVFRNWNLVAPERLAAVLDTTPDNVRRLARALGLVEQPVDPEFVRRGYITLLRRNWHLLPYAQLMQLVDQTEAELGRSLLEDDFLFIKFGRLKPQCEPLRWSEPSEAELRAAHKIRQVLRRHFGAELDQPGERRFAFVERLSTPLPSLPVRRSPPDGGPFQPRFIHSYFGLFGDPLMDAELRSFPEGLLQRLAAKGVNGIWLHVVLRHLAPGGEAFPEFGQGHEQRLENLRRLVARARKYGLGVYLYLNEPRAMPHAFFEKHPDCAGVREREVTALCTSVPKVRHWLESALAYVFRSAPGLAGGFTISASENLTHCASHNGKANCPRCKRRDDDEIIAEVNTLIERGVHAGNPDARVMVWDWGWHGHGDAPGIIARLPRNVWLMSVSEWALPIERGGVASTVGEYSLSAVGPGPRATRHWQWARQRGLRTVAKVQFNASWELSTIPYLPVLDLVAEHARRLAQSGVDGIMLSWTVGGYPSPNLEVARRFSVKPTPTPEAVLDALARERFGEAGAPQARAAWTQFSQAFREYPYHISVLYNAPVQIGPANLLYARPTGYHATMTGIPYDDLNAWRGPYPADVFARQFKIMAAKWQQGIAHLEKAVAAAPASRQREARAELRFARAACCIFRSVHNQVRFIQWRDQGSGTKDKLRALLEDEIRLAKTLYRLCQQDSRIGFEAANQYFFVPGDLLEKVVNCEDLKERMF